MVPHRAPWLFLLALLVARRGQLTRSRLDEFEELRVVASYLMRAQLGDRSGYVGVLGKGVAPLRGKVGAGLGGLWRAANP